jgi:ATP-dependent Lhr-like helicase
VLRQVRRKSLARLRREIEPVEQPTFVRFSTRWQGVAVPRRGLDALLDAIESLQGAAVLVSDLETEILPARIADYQPGNLDTLMAAGEVTWVGVEQIGDRTSHRVVPDGILPLCVARRRGGKRRDVPDQIIPNAEKLRISPAKAHPSLPKFTTSPAAAVSVTIIEALWQLVWAGRITTILFIRFVLVRPDDRKRKRVFDDERPARGYLRRSSLRTSAGQGYGRYRYRPTYHRGADSCSRNGREYLTAACSGMGS